MYKEIWRVDILNTSRRSNDIVLQKIQIHNFKAACAITHACDKIMNLNLRSGQGREMMTPVIDAFALVGVVTAEINQFRREQRSVASQNATINEKRPTKI